MYFSYPQRPDVEVISGVSLRLPAGTVTAFVGASGAGKSTMVQLLSQFYKVCVWLVEQDLFVDSLMGNCVDPACFSSLVS